MKTETIKILLIEDNPGDARLIQEILTNSPEKNFDIHLSTSLSKGLKILSSEVVDVVLSDLGLPDSQGIDTLEKLLIKFPMVPIIVITGLSDLALGLESVKKGAQDYLVKGEIDEHSLIRTISYAIERKKAETDKQERIKELNVLHNISIISEISSSIEEYAEGILDLIPTGFQYPETICCRLTVEGKTYQTKNFVPINSRFTSGIFYNDRKMGEIEVGLVESVSQATSSTILNEERELMITISKHIGVHLGNERARQIQQVIHHISSFTNTTSNLEELLEFIRNELSILIDTTNFYIALYEETTNLISIPYIADHKETITSFPAGKTLTSYVIETKKSLLGKRADLDRMAASGLIETIGEKAKVWLGIPLLIKGKVIGVFAVQSYTDENAYTESDLEMLEVISQQISISIERKKAEQELKIALEKAKESDRLKSAFLDNMSHEMRTPLNAVIGFSQLIDKDTSMDDIMEFVAQIKRGGTNLLGIIEDMLTIAIIESGILGVNKQEHQLSSIFNEIDQWLLTEQVKAQKQAIQILFTPTQNAQDIWIETDRDKLKQILNCLLNNALKFTNDGTVEYGYAIDSQQNKPVLEFFIKDTGMGIPKDAQQVIFDIFRQVDESHTRTHGGTGIGLSVCKRLVGLLGGSIRVESEEAKGSAFYFTIPHDGKKLVKQTEQPAKPVVLNYTGKTALIAEDEDSNFDLLDVLLTNINISVLWAKNGREALQLYTQNPEIDLVLMDLKMPGMDGYEATRLIRKVNPHLPIIAQTAYALNADRKQAISAGCNELLTKPIRKDELYKTIDRCLG